jgi:ribosomal protein S18 acetylase RimI-like enzyme
MIRKRVPRRDDRIIVDLVKRELFPYTRRSIPDYQWDPLDIRRRLDRNVTFVAAPRRSETAGFISLKPFGQVMAIDMLAVDRSRQGQGWGSRLMEEAERYARGKGCLLMRLLVDETNGRAIGFYIRHGYTLERYIPALKCYVMSKRL